MIETTGNWLAFGAEVAWQIAFAHLRFKVCNGTHNGSGGTVLWMTVTIRAYGSGGVHSGEHSGMCPQYTTYHLDTPMSNCSNLLVAIVPVNKWRVLTTP